MSCVITNNTIEFPISDITNIVLVNSYNIKQCFFVHTNIIQKKGDRNIYQKL